MYTTFDLLFDAISATTFGQGYTVSTFRFFFYHLAVCNVFDALILTYLGLVDQMHLCICASKPLSGRVQLSSCGDGRICVHSITVISCRLLINF